MTGLLVLGFLVGMRHALEADHLAAVATLATRTRTMAGAVSHGAAWGLGHTITLFAFGSLVIVLDASLSQRLAHAFELAVGVMLVVLGADVVRRLIRDRIHFHLHSHADGTTHFHAHSHRPDEAHDPDRHRHVHRRAFPWRALVVGLMHGMAGSAALILLTVGAADSPLAALAYMAVFGFGSMVGMAIVSAIVAIPLRYSPAGLTWLHNGLHAAVGVLTVALGVVVIVESARAGLLAGA